MRKLGLDDTIAAIGTPAGEGGIGIVRLSGPGALKIADEIFSSKDGRKPSGYKTYTVHYGKIVDRKSSIRKSVFIDEVILTVMKAPRSYTKEDIVEISCHGGIQATKSVLDLVLKRGARVADPGEFTKRAFLNGRIDLTQAEAVLDTIRSKTESSLKVAVNQLEGSLSRIVNEIRDDILDLASQIEASIDFPEEGIETPDKRAFYKKIDSVTGELKRILETYDEGHIYREGILAIICGKTNVGKSSLMNILLKRDRVIVSAVPGTTRDAVEEFINLKGIPIRLVDTAGISRTDDVVEREGVKRSKKYLGMADIVILVIDASRKLDIHDREIIELVSEKKKVVVLNKIDLRKRIESLELKKLFKGARTVKVSVSENKNIDLLENVISDLIWGGGFHQGEAAVLSNARHKGLLDKALTNMLSVKDAVKKGGEAELIAIDLKEAIDELGFIIGKSVSDDILDRIFQKFCIGK